MNIYYESFIQLGTVHVKKTVNSSFFRGELSDLHKTKKCVAFGFTLVQNVYLIIILKN